MLPSACPNPKHWAVAIVLWDQQHATSHAVVSVYRYEEDIVVSGEVTGRMTLAFVGPQKELPAVDRLDEIRSLVRVVAKRISVVAERHQAEQRLCETLAQLENTSRSLQDANTALKIVLTQIDREKQEIRQTICDQVAHATLPSLLALEAELNAALQPRLAMIRRVLQRIASPQSSGLPELFVRLTPAELEICELLRSGLSSKEIARMRDLSPGTVARHREHIRKKLGLTDRTINLAAYLQSQLGPYHPGTT